MYLYFSFYGVLDVDPELVKILYPTSIFQLFLIKAVILSVLIYYDFWNIRTGFLVYISVDLATHRRLYLAKAGLFVFIYAQLKIGII